MGTVTCVASGVDLEMRPSEVARSILLRDSSATKAPVSVPFSADAMMDWKNRQSWFDSSVAADVARVSALVKVCDGMRDAAGLQTAARLLTLPLLPSPLVDGPLSPTSTSTSSTISERTAATLLSLPEHLALTVLHIRKASAQDLLTFLPARAHPLVLRSLLTPDGAQLRVTLKTPAALDALIAALPTVPSTSKLALLETSPSVLSAMPMSLAPRLAVLQIDPTFSNFSEEAAQRLASFKTLTHPSVRGSFEAHRPTLAFLKSLHSLKHLQFLELSDCQIEYDYDSNDALDQSNLATLATALDGLSASLTHLELARNGLGDLGIAALAPSILSLRSLRFLSLVDNDISSDGFHSFAPCLSLLASLTELHLSDNPLGNYEEPGFQAFSLGYLSSLEILGLGNVDMGDTEARGIAPSLLGLTALRELRIPNNGIDCSGIAPVAPQMTALASLEVLDLTNNPIGCTGAEALSRALPDLTSLQQLLLDGINVRASGAKVIAASLPRFASLKTLRLRASGICASGAGAFAAHFSSVVGLSQLSLGANALGAAGAAELAPALPSLTSLVHLDLSSNELGDEGAATLLPALSTLATLEVLFLGDNAITATGAAEALAPALTSLPLLNTLDLSDNPLGPDGAAALVESLALLFELKHLEASGAGLLDEGVQALVPALGALGGLTYLGLSRNGATSAAREALAPVIQRLRFFETLSLLEKKY